jgi:hypothetical protein
LSFPPEYRRPIYKLAAEQTIAAEGSVADFIAAVLHLVDVADEEMRRLLTEHGTTPGRLVDHAIAVSGDFSGIPGVPGEELAGDAAAEKSDLTPDGLGGFVAEDRTNRVLYSAAARRAVAELDTLGFDAAFIAELLGLRQDLVEAYIRGRRKVVSPHQGEVLARHRRGETPAQISRELGVPRTTAVSIIKRLGEEPHTERGVPDSKQRKAVAMYKANPKAWKPIMDELGLTRWQLRRILVDAGLIKSDRPEDK